MRAATSVIAYVKTVEAKRTLPDARPAFASAARTRASFSGSAASVNFRISSSVVVPAAPMHRHHVDDVGPGAGPSQDAVAAAAEHERRSGLLDRLRPADGVGHLEVPAREA